MRQRHERGRRRRRQRGRRRRRAPAAVRRRVVERDERLELGVPEAEQAVHEEDEQPHGLLGGVRRGVGAVGEASRRRCRCRCAAGQSVCRLMLLLPPLCSAIVRQVEALEHRRRRRRRLARRGRGGRHVSVSFGLSADLSFVVWDRGEMGLQEASFNTQSRGAQTR